jgi:hypothetical protein
MKLEARYLHKLRKKADYVKLKVVVVVADFIRFNSLMKLFEYSEGSEEEFIKIVHHQAFEDALKAILDYF